MTIQPIRPSQQAHSSLERMSEERRLRYELLSQKLKVILKASNCDVEHRASEIAFFQSTHHLTKQDMTFLFRLIGRFDGALAWLGHGSLCLISVFGILLFLFMGVQAKYDKY